MPAVSTDDATFRQRYPDPVINGRRPAGLGDLTVWEVFDRSQQAEDPIRTSFWVVNPRGEKFLLDRGGIERALISVGFAPRDPAEALRVATLRYTHHGDYTLMEGPLLPRVGAPREALAQVDPPRVEQQAGRYQISFFVYFRSTTDRFYGRDNRALIRCTAEVGPRSLSLHQETIWSSL